MNEREHLEYQRDLAERMRPAPRSIHDIGGGFKAPPKCTYSSRIIWTKPDGHIELTTTSTDSMEAASEAVWKIARGMGWTPPKWWQWWRWKDTRAPS